jgi:hypothetical protein
MRRTTKIQWIVFLLVIVLSMNVFAGNDADETRKTWLIISGVTLGVVYATTIVLDYTIDSSVNFPAFFVPAVGPYIGLLSYDSKVSPYYSGRSRDILLMALSGTIQTAAAVGIALTLKKPQKNDGSDLSKRVAVNFSVMPRVGRGYLASCHLVF